MSLNEKLFALEQKYCDLPKYLNETVTLKTRVRAMESIEDKRYVEIKNRFKKYFNSISSDLDRDFDYHWEQWKKYRNQVDKIQANVILQLVAAIQTPGYKKKKNNLEYIAKELDIPHFTGLHQLALVEDDFRTKNLIKKRRKTKILQCHEGILKLAGENKDEKFRLFLDLMDKVLYMYGYGKE